MKLFWVTDENGKLIGIFNCDAIDYLDIQDDGVRVAMRNGHFCLFMGKSLEYFLEALKRVPE